MPFLTCLLCIFFNASIAQDFNQNNDWLNEWTNFDPNSSIYPEALEKLPVAISRDTYLSNDTVYLLSGDVYVTAGAHLTIEEGTVIRGDHKNPGYLIVTKGAKLIAVGAQENPIIFTSNKPERARKSGDWGGLIIAGNGFINTITATNTLEGNFLPQFSSYGGNAPEEQTAVMRYVRIEFAGNTSKRAENSSSLALYGMGSGSLLDNIMVSHSGHDSYNWRGGKLHANNIISIKAIDDDYQISEGFKGEIDNLMAIRHPYISSPHGSYAMEISGHNTQTGIVNPTLVSDVSIQNAVLINLSDNSNYMHTTAAITATNSASLYLNSAKVSGFSDVVTFDQSYTSLSNIRKKFIMDNSFFNIHGEGVKVAYKPATGILDILKYNRFTSDFIGVNQLFIAPQNVELPNFELKKSENNFMVMQ